MGLKHSKQRKPTTRRRRKLCSGCLKDDTFGLITNKGQQVPLNTVEVEVQVKGFVATVTSTLQYTNNEEEECPVEAIFVFSLPAEAAVCHFSAKICGEEVVAELHERVRAWELYDDAISSGQRAYIVQETEESPDVFSMVVGFLPPKESVFVTLVYVTELTVDADHGLRFCLPAVLNPRYTPSDMDLSRVTEMTAVSESLAACSLSLHIHITSPIAVSKVESNCSLDPLIYFNADHTEAEVSLSPGHRFDRDVEILLYYQNAHQPTAIVEAGCKDAQPGSLMADSVVMINLYPQFPPEMASSIGQRGEFIFLVDQSGSMAGSSIASARETLLLMLKSLPLGCYFNIYGFGSDFHSFFPTSVEYTQKTMEQAMKNVAVLRADRGGTEFLRPMEHIYCQDSLSDHPRQVFVITDGSVWNVKEILDLVRMHSRYHRCFTFGIGQGACTALVQGMAKEGGGIAQFIMSNERLQLKVMQSLSLAFLPFVSDVSVKWTVPDGIYVTDLIPPPNGLLQGQRALLYAQMSGKSSCGDEGTVTVQYRLGEQPVTNQLNFSLKPAEDTGLGIHRLAARALIQSLEMEEKKTYAREKATIDQSLRDKVVDLSVQSGVSSSFTAFLVVHKGSGHPVTGPMVDKRRPYNLRDFTLADDHRENYESEEPVEYEDPYMKLLSLQKAAGYWDIDSKLFSVFGKTENELIQKRPEQVDNAVWVTIVALIWLHSFKKPEQEEWKFIAIKATSWIRSRKVGKLSECIQAGKALLESEVKEESLGL